MKGIFLSILLFLSTLSIQGAESNKEYTLWYNRPAYNRGGNFSQIAARGFPYDEDWKKWSLPIGNGAMGVCIFGRTDVERIQLAEKMMGNKSAYGKGGFRILSNKRELCRIKYCKAASAQATDKYKKTIKIKLSGNDIFEFNTRKGEIYEIIF